MAAAAILDLWLMWILMVNPAAGPSFEPLYQIWCKYMQKWPAYGQKCDFQYGNHRHLGFCDFSLLAVIVFQHGCYTRYNITMSHKRLFHVVSTECRMTAEGHEYVGTVHTTATGKECVKWTSNYPHKHVSATTFHKSHNTTTLPKPPSHIRTHTHVRMYALTSSDFIVCPIPLYMDWTENYQLTIWNVKNTTVLNTLVTLTITSDVENTKN